MTHMNAYKKEKDTDVIFVCVCIRGEKVLSGKL